MNLNTLKPARGSRKSRKRIARGQGSGHGGTATRGHKGARSRSGYKQKSGFEGGQMPLQRRVPKSGFTNINRVEYKVINLDRLELLVVKHQSKKLELKELKKYLNISSRDKIKLLGRGEIKSKIEIVVNAYSESAKKAIEAVGGKVEKA